MVVKQIKRTLLGGRTPALVLVPENKEDLEEFSKYEGVELEGVIAEVRKAKKPRSKNMNSYMWVLCDKIAKKRHQLEGVPYSGEEIYRLAIREVGKWFDMDCDNRDVEMAIKTWNSKGKGWFSEVVVAQKYRTQLRFYIGSSHYNSEELRRLTDWVVEEAKFMGIETLTPDEINRLNQLWGPTEASL